MNILSSALGHYEVTGNPAEADCIIGHSFGTLIDETSVNRSLADFISHYAEGRPVVADRMLVNAFPDRDLAVDHIVEGPISNTLGQGVGTWGTLVAAKAFMEQAGLTLPLMVGQAHHIGRIVMQAEILGLKSIVPADLPRQFDRKSGQGFTRSLGRWVPREVLGSLILRYDKKL